MTETIPEGASRTFRVRVPDGRGSFKNLIGYSFVGYVKAIGDFAIVATMGGNLDPDDVTAGLIDLLPSHTTGKPGRYRLELEASNGSSVHVGLGTIKVEDR